METFFKVVLLGMVSMFAMSIYSIFEGIFVGHRLGFGYGILLYIRKMPIFRPFTALFGGFKGVFLPKFLMLFIPTQI